MLEMTDVMNSICGGISPQMTKYGFDPVYSEGADKKKLPLNLRGDKGCYIDWQGEKGHIRFVFNENRILMLTTTDDIKSDDDRDFTLSATYFFDLAEYGDKDIRSIVNEVNDYLDEQYSTVSAVKKKATDSLTTVSKSAAKSGALAYDPTTLALKLCALYPDYKDEIKANTEKYGEFLFEEFFVGYGNSRVLDTIRTNDAQKMKKLFNILNEIYEDGTNEVQSLITVTILGSINNDPQLIQNILPYVSDTMLEPVLAVNKYLQKSKSSRMRLSSPPPYKPKKKKASKQGGGILSQLGL